MKNLSLTFCLAITGLFTFAGQKSLADDLSLVCKSRGGPEGSHFLINTETMVAERIDLNPPIIGRLSVTENFYEMNFDQTSTHYALHIEINRYSGQFEWEHGTPPFGEFSEKNILRTGICEKGKASKKF